MDKQRYYLCIAGILGAWAVVMGALGAHAARAMPAAETVSTYETAVRYHFYHALAILAVAAGMGRALAGSAWVWACRLWTAGVVLFSGSLYALAVTGVGWLGTIAPVGGTAMILGWVFVVAAALRTGRGSTGG